VVDALQGLTEEEAVKKGLTFDVYTHTFSPLRAHMAARATPDKPLQQCYVKMLTEPGEGKLLGLHMVGEEAPEIIQVSLPCYCVFYASIIYLFINK
jgi:glutathione reductase (NADPH)